MRVSLLYFAWVREAIGKDGESIAGDFGSLEDLIDRLQASEGGYAEALTDRSRLRFAINRIMAGPGEAIADGDEVAIFLPVTGG